MERMYKGIRAPVIHPYVDKAAGGQQGGSALLKDRYGDTRDVAARGREMSSAPTMMTSQSRMLEDDGYESGFPVRDRFDCASLPLPLPPPLPPPLPLLRPQIGEWTLRGYSCGREPTSTVGHVGNMAQAYSNEFARFSATQTLKWIHTLPRAGTG
jgi:hypothetical protein